MMHYHSSHFSVKLIKSSAGELHCLVTRILDRLHHCNWQCLDNAGVLFQYIASRHIYFKTITANKEFKLNMNDTDNVRIEFNYTKI